MWIDINNHIGQWPYKKLIYDDCRSLVDRMDRFSVDKSVISSLNGIHYKNTQSANRDLYQEWKNSEEFTNRLIPFAVINPTYAGWKYDMLQCIEEYGMKGIAVYPKYHEYPVEDDRLIELAQLARDKDVIVALTLRMFDSRQRSWMDIDQEWALRDVIPIIRAVPDANYFIWNVANSTKLDPVDLEIVKRSSVLMDTSGRSINNLSGLLHEFGTDKFAFGSHSPILDYSTSRLRIEFLDVEEKVKDQLQSGNAAKMLKIK